MTIHFDRDIYFDAVRASLFHGTMNEGQVTAQDAILMVWETRVASTDLRWLAYMLATTAHETGFEMMPIEEYGKGSGMEYGKVDPETGQTYYGRGMIQTTWRDNYRRADKELGLTGDQSCEWHADNQLDPKIAAATMFIGMLQGWFRTSDGAPETLGRYFNDNVNDPYEAREIINGDKTKVPSWSNGVSIGNLIKGYHQDFLDALERAITEVATVPPEEGAHPPRQRWRDRDDVTPAEGTVVISVQAPDGITVLVNGLAVL